MNMPERTATAECAEFPHGLTQSARPPTTVLSPSSAAAGDVVEDHMLRKRTRRSRASDERNDGTKRPVIKDPVALAKALLAVEDDPSDYPSTRRGRRPKSLSNTDLPVVPKTEEAGEDGTLKTDNAFLSSSTISEKTPIIEPRYRRAKNGRLSGSVVGGNATIHAVVEEESVDKKPDPRALAAALLAMPDDSTEPAIRKTGRKRKLSPEEKMLLAQLHHDHFSIFHSKRWLLEDWTRKVSELGVCDRTPLEISNRIQEMILEVADYRQHTNFAYKMKMASYQMSPSFLLFNKIYDHLEVSFDRIEDIIDKYEAKTVFDQEEALIEEWKGKKTVVWKEAERKLLVDLFTANSWIFTLLPVRSRDSNTRNALLGVWASQISALGTHRTADEIEAKICEYRHAMRLNIMKNPKKRRAASPTADALFSGFENSPHLDLSWDLDAVLTSVKQIQDEILNEGFKQENKEGAGRGIYDPHINSCRTNRPHMSRREKHLLGLLYRKHYEEYEAFNHPHAPRKNVLNMKWVLLKEWAETLSSLGISLREPEELATKISQYKNIIKTHKQCMTGGVDSLTFKSEYKMRRCLRPLSPTTKLFDTADSSVDEEELTDTAISKYVKESQDVRFYPFSAPEKSSEDGSDETSASPELPSSSRQILVSNGVADKPVFSNPEDIRNTVALVANRISQPTVGECLAEGLIKVEPDTEESMLDSIVLPLNESDHVASFQNVFEGVYSDSKNMERLGLSLVSYDSVDTSGHVTKIAVSREENQRDINYFIWNKYMEVEIDPPLIFYVCYMCEQMATPGLVDGRRVRQPAFSTAFIPNGALLAQQSLPTIAITAEGLPARIAWSKMAPKHRCVPFLMSTMCEKLAGLSHMLIRTSPFPGD